MVYKIKGGAILPCMYAKKLTNQAVIEALDSLPPQKIHCSVLAEQAIKAVFEDYDDRKNGHLKDS